MVSVPVRSADCGAVQDTVSGLLRAVECFNDAVLFIDTSQAKWRILHLNTAAQTKLKLYDVVAAVDGDEPVLLWDMFQVMEMTSTDQHKTSPWQTHADKIKAGQTFVQPARFNVRYSSNSQSSPLFNLHFRCAARPLKVASSISPPDPHTSCLLHSAVCLVPCGLHALVHWGRMYVF